MSFVVNWTDESEITFNENIEYLKQEWNLAAINHFLDRVDQVVDSISSNPNLYPVHRKMDRVHKCILNKHVTLYYRVVDAQRVDLITFWNTHQDPKSLKI